jgi:glyoxylase-like metal-dependent hydrolase (beta-lactamase superfamily II)
MKDNPTQEKWIPMTSVNNKDGIPAASDIYSFTVQIVNVVFVGQPGQPNDWVLVDAGMPRSADTILQAAEARFGTGCRPKAIVLTHGHFDHVGAVVQLAERWNVPVYAHALELPYLTGQSAYPEPDPSVEGGLIAKISAYFPNDPVDLGERVRTLPANGSIPDMPGWRWIHTPGHAPGHVSLFRERDRVLIAGDAFITVKQDSFYKVLTQKREIHEPPRYYTTDWQAAKDSVARLEALKPQIAVTGHGEPMEGEPLAEGLTALVRDFDTIAVPDHGRYVDHPE